MKSALLLKDSISLSKPKKLHGPFSCPVNRISCKNSTCQKKSLSPTSSLKCPVSGMIFLYVVAIDVFFPALVVRVSCFIQAWFVYLLASQQDKAAPLDKVEASISIFVNSSRAVDVPAPRSPSFVSVNNLL